MSLGHGVSLHSETIFKSIKTTLNLRHTFCFYVFTGGRTLKLHLFNASNLNNLTFTETLKPHCPVLSEENWLFSSFAVSRPFFVWLFNSLKNWIHASLTLFRVCVQGPRSPGHCFRSPAAGRKLPGHPGSLCWWRGRRLWMSQCGGKPGSVTTRGHPGQLVKS